MLSDQDCSENHPEFIKGKVRNNAGEATRAIPQRTFCVTLSYVTVSEDN